jgi:hypothetical protein
MIQPQTKEHAQASQTVGYVKTANIVIIVTVVEAAECVGNFYLSIKIKLAQ